MEKHAFLIIAHSNEDDLVNLIKSIDFAFNDIFIHIDKKWKNCDFDKIRSAASFSSVTFSDKRLSVAWGAVSLVTVELLLLEMALSRDDYRYLHLLSGQDICIKPPLVFHNFFQANDGKEFLLFAGKDWQNNAQNRVKYFHLTCGRNRFKRRLNRILVRLQKILHINRLKNCKLTICGGSEWASLTSNFAYYLVSNKNLILQLFSHSFCADELYKQTFAFNSKFKENVFYLNNADKNDDSDPNMWMSNMRYIDWIRGKPYTFTESDFNDIKSSPYLFIRKVTSSNALPQMILNECIQNDSDKIIKS